MQDLQNSAVASLPRMIEHVTNHRERIDNKVWVACLLLLITSTTI